MRARDLNADLAGLRELRETLKRADRELERRLAAARDRIPDEKVGFWIWNPAERRGRTFGFRWRAVAELWNRHRWQIAARCRELEAKPDVETDKKDPRP
jgi:hypothetical protein